MYYLRLIFYSTSHLDQSCLSIRTIFVNTRTTTREVDSELIHEIAIWIDTVNCVNVSEYMFYVVSWIRKVCSHHEYFSIHVYSKPLRIRPPNISTKTTLQTDGCLLKLSVLIFTYFMQPYIYGQRHAKRDLGICKKCRPRPAAASPTQRLIRVCTF